LARKIGKRASNDRVMGYFAKIVLFLVIGAVAASPLAAQTLLLQTRRPEHPAKCHEHDKQAPPDSSSHHCCLTGHDIAVPQTSHSPEPLLQCLPLHLLFDSSSGSGKITLTEHSTLSSGAPPGATPLRV
jgi:hypothetical protein